ncbi:MAG: hypothetical protein J07HQW2_02535 [Haloquadratum walsbyi J07HQW2]|uniref:Uncharacterized protein n=1 Tax=Haloquadratum walsbyi J07HQW2 TaxID=1238425 RepID=U1NGU0_9EURY|nr:MAG: hypothetical protein J07HQW2_02535 [Haloquadratum walsbyi J07HQW2]
MSLGSSAHHIVTFECSLIARGESLTNFLGARRSSLSETETDL